MCKVTVSRMGEKYAQTVLTFRITYVVNTVNIKQSLLIDGALNFTRELVVRNLRELQNSSWSFFFFYISSGFSRYFVFRWNMATVLQILRIIKQRNNN